MKLQMAGFAGEIPKIHPRLLGDSYAQQAVNTKLEDGSLTPIRLGRLDYTLPGPGVTIYRIGTTWTYWPHVVYIAPGPVNDKLLYVTNDGSLAKLYDATGVLQVESLALERPTNKLTANLVEAIDEDTSVTVIYAYTNVTRRGEESEPSPVSDPIQWAEGAKVYLTGFSQYREARSITKQRIYRSITSALGVTTLNFIYERDFSTGPFTDESFPAVEPIPSTDYNPPPAGLTGIKSGPNGMMAAFVGKRLYFCEPYIPHAWPEKYILTTDYEIVGLAWFGGSLAVMTKGVPYVVTGTAPDNMTMEKLELNLPCINARGIVDLGYTIAYPSHAGLVTISSSGAVVATQGSFTRDQWLQMNPYSFVAGQYAGRYMASYAYTDQDGEQQRGILIIDLSGATPFIMRCSDFADAIYYDIETGSVYLLKDQRQIYEWDALSQPYSEQTWMSKRFVLPTYTNFGALLIEGDDISDTSQIAEAVKRNDAIRAANRQMIEGDVAGGDLGSKELARMPFAGTLLSEASEYAPAIGVTVVADGKEVAYVSKVNDVARLPSGFLAKTWELIVRGNIQVTGIVLASSPSEIARG